jgi:16S rRNA (guanine(1405)-N(7))-methyltransferase
MNLPAETVQDLIRQEIAAGKPPKEVERSMREKLHQIIAPYLGDPDYDSEEKQLAEAAEQGEDKIKEWCLRMLAVHTSSKERIPQMEEFYQAIFDRIGKPKSILDVACAFNPFAFPWMGLPRSTAYHAYDLHAPRVNLINNFFKVYGMEPLAETRDILINPPEADADAAFFFKEAHRFESRKKGCNRNFWISLPVKTIVVTLPAENLTGQHQMRDRQRSLIQKNIEGLGWNLEETEIAGEMIFFIDKKPPINENW